MKNKKNMPEKIDAQQEKHPEFVPLVDIYEKDSAIQVYCDLPGVNQDDLEITLENQELIIRGEQQTLSTDGLDCVLKEYERGVFVRRFNVSHMIDEENIKAKLTNGVLELTLPKSETAQPRKITVHTT